MSTVLALLGVQIALGGLDNLWHHEITERLPARREARGEVALHAARELIYGALFIGLAWHEWRGAWAALPAGLLLAEIAITVADFLVEDRTRRLPPFERVLHTLLAINAGAVLAVLLPVLHRWWAAPTALQPVSYGAWSWLLSAAGAGVALWGVRNAVAVARLRRPPAWQREPLRAGAKAQPATVLVTGATGFIGREVVGALVRGGDRVLVLTRDAARARACFGPHARVLEDLDAIGRRERIDAIVNLAGAPIAAWPWSRRRRRRLLSSRLHTTRAVVRLIDRLEGKPGVLISASAVGYYGVRGDEILTERSPPQRRFQSRLCALWERMARRAERHGVRVCLLRMGVVLAEAGGMLPRLTLPMRLGLAVRFGHGEQWMPWIDRRDAVRLIAHLLADDTVRGAVNAVAPEVVRHGDLVRTASAAHGHLLPVALPAPVLRRALGEMAELLLDGQLVVPAVALGAGFRFDHPCLADALASMRSPRPRDPWRRRRWAT